MINKVSKEAKVAFFLFLIGLLFCYWVFFINKILIHPNFNFYFFSVLKLVLILLTVFIFITAIYYSSKIKIKKYIQNSLQIIFSLVILVLILELVFTFYIKSTSVYTDMSNQLWHKLHFKPINSLGYRDDEPIVESNKPNILIIGDSFIAGAGLKHDEILTSKLKNHIGNEFNIFNLGVSGSHTDRQFDSLINYPIDPDILVLAYYHNDIESAMIKYNLMPEFSNPMESLCKFRKAIVNKSLFANFIFVNYIARPKISTQFMESPKNDLLAYLNKDLWDYQTYSLDKFNNYCIQNNVKFIMIIFPGMGEGIAFSNFMAGIKVEEYCEHRNINYINAYDHISHLPMRQRVANQFDHHPSATVNKIIAKVLASKIIEVYSEN